jgi:hypothetical protein
VNSLKCTRERGARGPKPRLTVDQIVAAAIEIADIEGLEGPSMRRRSTGRGHDVPVSLRARQGRVAGRDGRLGERRDRAARRRLWRFSRARLEQVARENRRLYERHPWLLQAFPGRLPLGSNVMAKYDYELRAFEGIGLSDVEMDSVLTLVLGYVRG